LPIAVSRSISTRQVFGLLLGAQAPAALVGVPIAGQIIHRASYLAAFAVGGASVCVSGLVLALLNLPMVSRSLLVLVVIIFTGCKINVDKLCLSPLRLV
jgi:hypothetical protein